MRCRSIIDDGETKNIVWFGSYGKDPITGKAKKANNFSSDTQAIIDSITQKLLVIKGELWHNVNFGLPLADKIKTKSIIDMSVIKIVNDEKYVLSIVKFNSFIVNKSYHMELIIDTTLGKINVNI